MVVYRTLVDKDNMTEINNSFIVRKCNGFLSSLLYHEGDNALVQRKRTKRFLDLDVYTLNK